MSTETIKLYCEFKQGDTSAVWKRVVLGAPFPVWVNEYLEKTSSSILELDSTAKGFREGLVSAVGVKAKQITKRKEVERDKKIVELMKGVEDKRYGWKTKNHPKIAALKEMPGEGQVKKVYETYLKEWKDWEQELGKEALEDIQRETEGL